MTHASQILHSCGYITTDVNRWGASLLSKGTESSFCLDQGRQPCKRYKNCDTCTLLFFFQMAISAVAGILKQLKRTHKKLTINPYEISEYFSANSESFFEIYKFRFSKDVQCETVWKFCLEKTSKQKMQDILLAFFTILI